MVRHGGPRPWLLAALLVTAGLFAWQLRVASADDGRRMDGWYAYDYRAGLDVTPAVNVFHPATETNGEVWVDQHRWSIDDPESPPSVLALVRYDEWDLTGGAAATTSTAGDDLRETTVCFDLRGRDLDLRGGEVTFWVMSTATGQRWHHKVPLEVGDGWTAQRVDTSGEWRNSWRWDPKYLPELESTLRYGTSYGVAFVGFDSEPSGMLGMRDFRFC